MENMFENLDDNILDNNDESVSINEQLTINEYDWSELENDDSLTSISLLLRDIGNYSTYSAEEERRVFTEYIKTRNKDIKHEIALHNVKLVIHIAKDKVRRSQGLALEEHIANGMLGLMVAIDKFNPDLGYKFSTYATWWIKQAINREYANTKDIIRIPIHANEKICKINRIKSELEQKNARNPSNEEVINAGNLSDEDMSLYKDAYKTINVGSLDISVGESTHHDETYLGDFVEDEKATDMFLDIEREELRNTIFSLLDRFCEISFGSATKERNKQIILRRFGFIDGKAYTLEEIGCEYGLTRERVRQISDKFITFLKRPANMRILREYV